MYCSFLKKLTFLLAICLLSSASYAQILTGPAASNRVKGAEMLKINAHRNTIDFVRINASFRIEESNHFKWLNTDLLKLRGKSTLLLSKKESDKDGFTHYKYKQFFNGIPVEYSTYTAHCKDGRLVNANGEYYDQIIVSTQPSITKEVAFQKSLAFINAKKYKGDDSNGVNPGLQSGQLIIFPKESKYYLAYKFDIYALSPLKRAWVYVDAHSGNILFQEDRIHNTDVQAVALTAFSSIQEITTDSINATSYRLRETGRGNGISTLNLQNGTNYAAAVDFTDNNNVWNTTTIDQYATDAHFGAEKTYDFYFSHFGRNSYDNAGAPINSYVHYSSNYVNAFWDGTEMTYGDGDGIDYLPLTSLEIIGHEITHAVTENTAALVYSNESGALNESFSDIFGNTIRFEYSAGNATWLVGDQILVNGGSGTPFRNMADPNQYQCADTYGGTYFNNGDIVHYDSGIQNFWYYLLSTGGSGVNDNGDSYLVNGIGIPAARSITFRNLSVYLTPNSTFADARFYAIQSAIDLYGSCSNEVIQTTNAWFAVGVGGVFSNAVVAGFTSSQNYFCAIPATVNFNNVSLNATSYSWDFGDGSPLSTASSPSHIYANAGVYSVTLIANGNALCSSSDTILATNYITVTNGGGPLSAQCTPATTLFCCDIGIVNVQFGTINKSSANASEGYKDFSCTAATTITAGDPVSFDISTSFTNFENVKGWIDYNNDGVFSNVNEAVFTSLNKKNHHTGIVNTAITAVLNTPLRMRIMDDAAVNTGFTSCTSPQNGQAEDYTITFTANTLPPVADFTSDVTVINVGGSVKFSDLSIHAPTGWQWSFPGGNPTTSTLQNPTVLYNTLGTYPVTLVVTNGFGTDSITKTAYINVVSSINMCNGPSVTSAPNGQLYDSGGPNGDYVDNENCSLLIDPGCAISITLSFTQFITESCCDFISVYNGTSTNDPLLISISGGTAPSPVTATSGTMFIVWSSDFSVTGNGWEASWTSVTGSGNPPVATFSTSNSNPPVGTPVQFTDQTTNLPLQWSWDFGDGQTATTQNPTHAYSTSGNFTVTLIGYNCISSDTTTSTITVQGPPEISINPDTITVNLSACGDSITVPFTIYNIGSGDLVYTIDQGGTGIVGDTSILVIQDGSAWNLDMSTFIQSQYNITPTVINSTQVSAEDFFQYDLIITVGAQSANYYAILTANQTKFEAYVNAGGLVQNQTAVYSGTADVILVGGTTLTYGNLQNTNTGLLLNHPILNGISNPLNGNSANHCTISNYPAGTAVISETGTGNFPTTVEYNYGNGTVIATGMTWEYLYVNAYNSGQMLPNSLEYLFSKISSGVNWISINGATDTIVPGDSAVVYVTINSGGLSGGPYTANIIINSNDPNSPSDTVVVNLNVGFNPCANFTSSISSGCTGIVAFNDTSLNSPTSWAWDFGDGQTSLLQNPSHTYSAIGTYNVKLVVCNGLFCDSITKQVIVNVVNGPTAACITTTTAYCCGMGITNVTLNTLNHTSTNGIDGYQDFSCNYGTTLFAGLTYTISVTTGTVYNENVRAWIDYDEDGTFISSELILTSNNVFTNHSASFTVPANANIGSARLRITSDYFSNAAPGPCTNPQYGQTEDYYVYITPNSGNLPPVANYITNASNNCTGLIQFTDNSTNIPTLFQWNFGDGNTSALQNPLHQYLLPGSYTVELIVSNNFGADTISQTVIVNFVTASTSVTGVLLAGQVLQFTGTTVGATSYLWDFGDLQSSILQNPTHTYTFGGTYYVTLTASNALCSVIAYDTISLSAVGISELSDLNSLNLSPNPFNNELLISYHLDKSAVVTMEASDVLGKSNFIFLNNEAQVSGNYNYKFNPVASGVYFIKLTINGETVSRKIVKIE